MSSVITKALPIHISLKALVILMLLLISTTTNVLAASVTIKDAANVLDKQTVQDAASKVAYPVKILTMNNFRGTQANFQTATNGEVKTKRDIVIAIETKSLFIAMASGKDTNLTNSQLKSILDTIEDTYESTGSYTRALLAALPKLPQQSGTNWTVIIVIIAVIIGIIVLIRFFRKKKPQYAPAYGTPGYPSGYPPPGYGHGHHPHHHGHYGHDSGGMDPLAAGALGAVAGGAIGYGLGQHMAQQEEESVLGASASEDIDEEDMAFGESDFGGGFSESDFGGDSFDGGDF